MRPGYHGKAILSTKHEGQHSRLVNNNNRVRKSSIFITQQILEANPPERSQSWSRIESTMAIKQTQPRELLIPRFVVLYLPVTWLFPRIEWINLLLAAEIRQKVPQSPHPSPASAGLSDEERPSPPEEHSSFLWQRMCFILLLLLVPGCELLLRKGRLSSRAWRRPLCSMNCSDGAPNLFTAITLL
jgi:hypothetical protein